jgi:Zn finger protein HypA/HybF involved in hydrogenase expression
MIGKSMVALAAVALALSPLAVQADDAAPVKAAPHARKSMAEKGAFHRIHAQKEKLDCKDCHAKKPLPDNTLKLRLHQPLAKDSPGPVTTDSCHECHGKKQRKLVTWYAPKEPRD